MKVEQNVLRPKFIQVSTTVDSKKTANAIWKELLKRRFASCVQIVGPATSHYWWKGRIQQSKEWLCLIKARASDYRIIETCIKKMHPYDVPEIIALPVLYGESDYLNWVRVETARRGNR
jgi:periplasmic divalent cation tolerance protein